MRKALIILIIIFAIALSAGYLDFKQETLLGNNGNTESLSGNNVSLGNISQVNISGDGYMYLQGMKKVGNVEFSNIRIKKINRNKCEFLADVENLTEEYLKPQSVMIKVIDDSGRVDEIFAGILTELAPYEPNTFKTQVLSDITDVVDIEIEIDVSNNNEIEVDGS